VNTETHTPTPYERVTYKPVGAKRATSIFLREPSEKIILGESHLVGSRATSDGSVWETKGCDERIYVIALDQILTRVPMRVSKRYGLLENVVKVNAYDPDTAGRATTWSEALDFAERCATPDSNIG
jgi:hypothetical protein